MHKKTTIKRRKSTRIYIKDVPIGDNAPITIQSMTKTKTTNILKTIQQIKLLEKSGVDLIRISVPTMEAVEAFKLIKKKTEIPLIADVHFDYRIAIKVMKYGADCLRINPGNIGNKQRILKVINYAKDHNIPIRIGVNSGSLEKKIKEKFKGKPTPEALVESAMKHVNILEKLNFDQFKVSVKSSDAFSAIQSYRLLAKKIDQPLHIGITEAGSAKGGSIKSAIVLGTLLLEGIGDTIRVSLSSNPIEEVEVAFNILKALRIRLRGINFISCPSCSRQEFNVIKTVKKLENKLKDITTPMDVSIIGCIVNGPGEAMFSDIGISGAKKTSNFYENGYRKKERIKNEKIIEEIEKKIREKAKKIKINKKKY